MATITGTEGDDTLFGGRGSDRITGLGGDDLIYGMGKHDTLGGGAGDDTIWGNRGHDALGGGEGNDRLFGESGDDVLDGMAGKDRLNGGEGADTLYGGTGHDRFIYDAIDPAGANDVIMDFAQGPDHITFKRDALNADGNLTFIGTEEFSNDGQGEIRYITFSALTLILVDVDGVGGSDFEIELQGAYDLTADDFIAG